VDVPRTLEEMDVTYANKMYLSGLVVDIVLAGPTVIDASSDSKVSRLKNH
jgi:hypothetical protein